MYRNQRPARPMLSDNMEKQAQEAQQRHQYTPYQPYHNTRIQQTAPHGSLAQGTPPNMNYSRMTGPLPTFSPQALQTFAPRQLGVTNDAPMVPIQSLQPEKAFVVKLDFNAVICLKLHVPLRDTNSTHAVPLGIR